MPPGPPPRAACRCGRVPAVLYRSHIPDLHRIGGRADRADPAPNGVWNAHRRRAGSGVASQPRAPIVHLCPLVERRARIGPGRRGFTRHPQGRRGPRLRGCPPAKVLVSAGDKVLGTARQRGAGRRPGPIVMTTRARDVTPLRLARMPRTEHAGGVQLPASRAWIKGRPAGSSGPRGAGPDVRGWTGCADPVLPTPPPRVAEPALGTPVEPRLRPCGCRQPCHGL